MVKMSNIIRKHVSNKIKKNKIFSNNSNFSKGKNNVFTDLKFIKKYF